MKRLLSGGAVVVASLAAGSAGADVKGFQADAFVPAEVGSRWFALDSVDLRGHGRMALGVVANYTYRGVVDRAPDGSVRSSLVRDQVTMDIGASFIFRDRIRLSFDVPLQIVAGGHAATIGGQLYAPPHDQATLGDVRLGGDVRVLGRYGDGAVLALGGQLFVPSGDPASFSGDGEPRFRPHVLFAYLSAPFAGAAEGGLELRGRDEAWADGRIGANAFAGVSAGLMLLRSKLLVGPEIYGQSVITGGAFFTQESSPLEALLGAHLDVEPRLRFGLGAGAGLVHAYGAPAYRALLSMAWVPDDAPPPPAPAATKECKP